MQAGAGGILKIPVSTSTNVYLKILMFFAEAKQFISAKQALVLARALILQAACACLLLALVFYL